MNRLREKWASALYHLYGHRAAHRRTDVYVVSFPKSGRTWLRAMLGEYVARVGGVPFTTELDRRSVEGVPTIAFSHRLSDVRRHRGKRVIFLVRDPRDVVVSYFHQLHDRQRRYRGSLADFVRGRHGINHVVGYLNRLRSLEGHPSEVLTVRYEDLHRDAHTELARVLAFVGLRVDRSSLDAAVAFGEFDNMQRLERSGGFGTDRLQATDVENVDSYKVRRGRVGSYREELDDDDIAYVEDRIAAGLRWEAYRA